MNTNLPNREGEAPRTSATRTVILDLLAGLAAIVLVVGVSIRAAFVGSDLRALFAVSAVAFFGAGVLRGRTGISSSWLKGLVVSSPGLLGTAALIMNDGLHRLPIPVAVSILSIAAAIAGIQTRRWWRTTRQWSVLLGAAFFLTLGVGIPTGVPRLANFASLKRVDLPQASFALSTFEGAPLRSQDLADRVVVLAFWASWCLPCRWELPEVQAAYEGFRDNPRVQFLAVDVGWAGETRERGRNFLTRQGLTVPAAFDAGEAAVSLQVDSLPTLIVIDGNGHIRMTHHGYDRSERVGEQITQIVRELLAETRGREASSH
jgi:thiol-disulfide isomerase/thioredoxin